MYKRKEKDKTAFYFPAVEWVLPAASSKELEEREFAVASGASVHIDLNSAELETKKPLKMSKNWTHSSQLCFSKIHRQFSPSENSAKITGFPTSGPVVRNHNSSKMADG